MQLPCTGHPTHSPPAGYGTGTDPGLKSDPAAMLCSTVLQATASRSSSECRTMQLGSFTRLQEDLSPARCWGRYTGCHYEVALLTFKVCSTSTPSHVHDLIQEYHDWQQSHVLRSATMMLCNLPERRLVAHMAMWLFVESLWRRFNLLSHNAEIEIRFQRGVNSGLGFF